VIDVLPAEALAGALLAVMVGAADRTLRWRVPAWAVLAVILTVGYGARREAWLLALCMGLALPLAMVLSALARRHGVTIMVLATAWSSAAAALATPDTEGPLLLAGFLATVALVTLGRTPTPSTTLALLVAVAWALAVAHGAGGRPPSLMGAIAAWAVPIGALLGGGLPGSVFVGLHVVVAPWLARVTGLRDERLRPLLAIALVSAAVALLSAWWQRRRRHADHGAARVDVAGDHGPGADHDIVADPAAG